MQASGPNKSPRQNARSRGITASEYERSFSSYRNGSGSLFPGNTKPPAAPLGTEFKGLVAAMGNWAIETANSESPFRGGGKDNASRTMSTTPLWLAFTTASRQRTPP